MMTTEMGKTLASAKAEVTKCANACRYYAEHAERFLADEPADADAVGARTAYVRYQPLGPVLAVMPWNFPLWQAMRFAAPALMAGNVGLLKHASNVPQTALFMQELFAQAGFPDGRLPDPADLLGPGRGGAAGRPRGGRHPDRQRPGRPVGGGHRRRRRSSTAVLELGGSDPFVVMPSADLEQAAKVAADARLLNNGQSCINAKRFIVHRDVVDAVRSSCSSSRCRGQHSRRPLRRRDRHRPAGHRAGARRHRGTRRRRGRQGRPGPVRRRVGPTDPAGTTRRPCSPASPRTMRSTSEEVFGPVASVYRGGRHRRGASNWPTRTEFGLGSNAWTDDAAEIDRFIRDLEAGMVFVNGNTTSYPELPFGGIKGSGYGRELSDAGIREFCNLKTVWISEQGSAGESHTE